MTRTQKLIAAVSLLVIGILFGWLILSGGLGSHDDHADHNLMSEEELQSHVLEQHTDEEGNIIYTCSMHPDVRQHEPGNCPICGMDLVMASSDDRDRSSNRQSLNENEFRMTPAAMQLARVQTEEVASVRPKKTVNLTGRIEVDEREVVNVSAHFPGRVTALNVNFTGTAIEQNQPMATVYSPELIAAQRELIEAVKRRQQNPQLLEMARQKLRNWEIGEEQIRRIEESGQVVNELEIVSPVNGIVLERRVSDRDYVSPGTVLYQVASINRVWLLLDLYEEDLQWLNVGDEVRFRTRSHPSEEHTAQVEFVDPVIDAATRTVRVRATVENRPGRFKPGMIARAILDAELAEEVLVVPTSAVMWTGPRSVVFVEHASDGDHWFEAREVTPGPRTGTQTIITEGLAAGERVVTNGTFRVDSEAQLRDRLSMMNRTPGSGGGMMMPGMDHGDMDMDMDMDGHDHEEMESQQQRNNHDHSDAIDGATDDFREEFKALLAHYLDGKEALFESDTEAVNKAFQQAAEKLGSIGMHRMEGDAHVRWMGQYEAIEGHLNQITETENMESRREGFSLLSQVLIEAVNNYAVPGVVYHQYCPMEDANWLSRNEQIQNPYAPGTMPNCGEVIERIET
ncbi:MAG: efflux RND transporter periplasmic adaptor subunit [Balneolaceae bacterium]